MITQILWMVGSAVAMWVIWRVLDRLFPRGFQPKKEEIVVEHQNKNKPIINIWRFD